MPDTSWFDKALPAFAALAGVLVTGSVEWIKTASTRRHEAKALCREKLEAIATALVESSQWFADAGSATTHEFFQFAKEPIASRKVVALTLVYFPELRDFAERYLAASLNYSDVLTMVNQRMLMHDMTTTASLFFPDDHNRAIESLAKARKALDDAIAAYARKHVR